MAGTSGYDFLTRVNNLFVDTANEQAMTDCYAAFTGEPPAYAEVAHQAKHQIMHDELAAEVERLTGLLATLCEDHRRHRDHTRRELRHALRELVANFPVYRTYVQPGRPASAADHRRVAEAVSAAVQRAPDIDAELLEFLGQLAVGSHGGELETEFAQRLPQLTGPVMAKGVEDTAFYRYHRLVSLNEVGGDPGIFGRPVADFHTDTAAIASRWPDSMLTLSTHDTKRSADVRARLNVLSELPDAWRETVDRWTDRNNRHRQGGWPDRNAEYLIYQTLVGAWPVTTDRVVAFMAKATREAKVHTSWIEPNGGYDDAVASFVKGILADETFLHALHDFLREHRIIERGRQNSLAQTALLLTSPGVPDLYQGSELWELSLVDPDNRRPVDYDLRRRLLAELSDPTTQTTQTTPTGHRQGPRLLSLRRGTPRPAARSCFSSTACSPTNVVIPTCMPDRRTNRWRRWVPEPARWWRSIAASSRSSRRFVRRSHGTTLPCGCRTAGGPTSSPVRPSTEGFSRSARCWPRSRSRSSRGGRREARVRGLGTRPRPRRSPDR